MPIVDIKPLGSVVGSISSHVTSMAEKAKEKGGLLKAGVEWGQYFSGPVISLTHSIGEPVVS